MSLTGGLLEWKKKNEVASNYNSSESVLTTTEKVQLALSLAQECIQIEELQKLFETKEHPICYDGFEPSGRLHIAQGIIKVINVNKLTKCGCVFIFWVADWFAFLNNKMGADLEKIKVVGQYFIETWKVLGMDMRNVKFVWTSEEINKDPMTYWTRVLDISRRNTVSRIKRCSQIMGRAEGDDQPASSILYPCMQCGDIFHLKADICQLGMDQRKVNVLAREYAEQTKQKPPIILSHPMLPGLLEGQEKMSKSNADSAIFMEDSSQEVIRKIKQAYCPPNTIEKNPCIAYVENIIFPKYNKFTVERSHKNGGLVVYETIDAFRQAYTSGSLHPGDLKSNLSRILNEIIEPVRQHFKINEYARELLNKIHQWGKK